MCVPVPVDVADAEGRGDVWQSSCGPGPLPRHGSLRVDGSVLTGRWDKCPTDAL